MPMAKWVQGYAAVSMALVVLSGPLAAGPVEDEIERLSASLNVTGETLFGDARLGATVLIPQFYQQRGHTVAWHGTENEAQLFSELNRALLQGFRPVDFNLPQLYELQERAATGAPEAVAQFDLAATDAAIKLVHHTVFGKVDASALDADWNFSRPVVQRDPATVLNAVVDDAGFSDLMAQFDLELRQYQQLMQALQSYRGIDARGGWPVVPDDVVLKPGMSDPAVVLLRQRLAAEGVAGEADVLSRSAELSASAEVYDNSLLDAVVAFQARHGLEADGVVGPRSFASLNRTPAERVDQIRLSLERARWIMRDLEDDFVLVNIAGARTYFAKGDTIWTTRSITGSAYRKTPVFRDAISYVEFNPTWTVPASILRKDKLARIRSDLNYLARNNYSVVRSSDRTPIDPAAVNWASDNPGVTLVQQPGSSNALGRVKFMFPNKYAVYLHDTNEPGLFDRNERNLSSGCVRLEYPFEFASLLLEGQADWSAERMAAILESGKTTRIDLDKPVPVLLTYWTAWVEDDIVHFREDPYDRDGPVLAALNR